MNETIVPPNSKESEMMVLGCMLTSDNALGIGADSLEDADFYCTEHKVIFWALKAAYRNDKPADVHLIAEDLKRQNQLTSIGGIAYLISLAQYAGTSAYIEEYVDELKRLEAQRRIITVSLDAIKRAQNGEEPHLISTRITEKLCQLEQKAGSKNKFSIRFLNEFDENFMLIQPSKKPMLFEYVDDNNSIGWLPKGIVGMLVGAGGLGKTHFLAQLAISIATGTSFLGSFVPTIHCGKDHQGSVFLGLGENQYDDIHRLLYKSSAHLREKGFDLLEASKRIAVYSFCGQQAAFVENRRPSKYFRELKSQLQDLGPLPLIILDPVSRLLGTDAEVDNAAATQFIALLEELASELPGNPTILFAHHVNKASLTQGVGQNQTAARGSSAFTDGVRLQINLSKATSDEGIENNIIMKMTKTNFTAIFPEKTLQKDTDGYIRCVPEPRIIGPKKGS